MGRRDEPSGPFRRRPSPPRSFGILNAGPGAWAFEAHAERLARALWLEGVEAPAERCYLLGWDEGAPPPGKTFIPWDGIRMAADKRLQAAAFAARGVPMPETRLLATAPEVADAVRSELAREWVLKWPTGCGAGGHRLIAAGEPVPEDWPRPYVLQEFVRLERPEVYRLCGVAGALFGWNARRFPPGTAPSPWVAHARGARYQLVGEAPPEALEAARRALEAAGLLQSFGCVDLLPGLYGWLVLEVGTDGVFNHVDRDLGIPELEQEIERRLAEAFWRWVGETPPWGTGGWRPRL